MKAEIKRNRKIYTASPFAKAHLLYLQEIGHLTVDEKHSSFRKKLDSFLLVYVAHGSGQVHVKDKAYTLNAGYLVLLNCIDGYTLQADNQGWQIYWIHLNGLAMPEIYRTILDESKNIPIFSLHSIPNLKELWQKIFTILESEQKIKELLINEQLYRLINQLLIMNETFAVNHTKQQEKMQRIREYLKKNFAHPISLDYLAQQFYINKYYLTRIYKETYQQTITQTLTQIRITQAKELLRYSDLSMDEIAIRCGFQDASYFSKVFKKTEGESPQKYRTSW
ncbi:AraC family transcriptional regulator [Enterococcus cecorum]|nr:AraC family transcriptional regulator [Enterococcus cecorum]